jgi:hypothetical protein
LGVGHPTIRKTLIPCPNPPLTCRCTAIAQHRLQLWAQDHGGGHTHRRRLHNQWRPAPGPARGTQPLLRALQAASREREGRGGAEGGREGGREQGRARTGPAQTHSSGSPTTDAAETAAAIAPSPLPSSPQASSAHAGGGFRPTDAPMAAAAAAAGDRMVARRHSEAATTAGTDGPYHDGDGVDAPRRRVQVGPALEGGPTLAAGKSLSQNYMNRAEGAFRVSAQPPGRTTLVCGTGVSPQDTLAAIESNGRTANHAGCLQPCIIPRPIGPRVYLKTSRGFRYCPCRGGPSLTRRRIQRILNSLATHTLRKIAERNTAHSFRPMPVEDGPWKTAHGAQPTEHGAWNTAHPPLIRS